LKWFLFIGCSCFPGAAFFIIVGLPESIIFALASVGAGVIGYSELVAFGSENSNRLGVFLLLKNQKKCAPDFIIHNRPSPTMDDEVGLMATASLFF
jgi:hypothetical protein